MCVWVGTHTCRYLQRPEEGAGFPRAVVTGHAHWVWVLGTDLRPPIRALNY